MSVQYYHCDFQHSCSKTFDERKKRRFACVKSTNERGIDEWSGTPQKMDDGAVFLNAICSHAQEGEFYSDYFRDYFRSKRVKLYLKDYPVTDEINGQLFLPLKGIYG